MPLSNFINNNNNMKMSISFSVERGLIDEFISLLEKERQDKNEIIQRLLYSYIDEHKIKMLKCPKCSAQYSSKISECPQCKLKEREQTKQLELIELIKRRDKMLLWLAEGKAQSKELEILDTEIAILQKELGLDDKA